MISLDIGDLADPSKYHEPIDVGGIGAEQLVSYLEVMIKIRMVEQHIADMRRDGMIGGPVHLGVGQEAVAVGVSACLSNKDYVFGAHRSHSHLLALGSDIHGLFAEVLGKATGLSRGMGGSMHLWDAPKGFYGSVPIVSGTVSLAVGAGLSSKLRGADSIGVTYFGDGAAEEGVVHESLNLARIMKLPILFVVENNLFSSHMHISQRQPQNSIARFAKAHDIRSEVVDGNDVVAIQKATSKLVSAARAGQGPGFLEAVTSRWYGHVDWREDIDVGVNRSTVDLQNWRDRDPIARLVASMRNKDIDSDKLCYSFEQKYSSNIADAWNQAMSDPYPNESTLLDAVYSSASNDQ